MKKNVMQFLPPIGGIHTNFNVCIPTNDKEAPEIAYIMQREHNRILQWVSNYNV